MTVLDRYLAWRCISAFLMILLALLIAVTAIDATARMGEAARHAHGTVLLLRLYLLRIPEQTDLLATPAMLISILVACTPMLRRGEFIALAAVGVAPQRCLRMAFAFAIVVSLMLFVLRDDVMPLTSSQADLVQDALENQVRDGKCWTIPMTGTDWFAAHARTPSDREIDFSVVAACPRSGGMLRGDRLAYRDGRWRITGHLCHTWMRPDGSYALEFPDSFPLEDEWAMPFDPPALNAAMLSDAERSGAELLRRRSPRDLSVLAARVAHALAPALATLVLIPVFVRFANRDHLVAAIVRAIAAAAVPCVVLSLADYVDAVRTPLAVDAAIAVLAATPGTVAIARWRL